MRFEFAAAYRMIGATAWAPRCALEDDGGELAGVLNSLYALHLTLISVQLIKPDQAIEPRREVE